MISSNFVQQVGPLKWLRRYSTLVIRRRLLQLDSRLRLPTGNLMILPKHSHNASEVYVTNADMDWGAEALFALCADTKRDFLDVGAHVGYYSSYLAPCVRRVYAFEPDPRNLPTLHQNAALAGNVTVIEMAVSSNDHIASFHLGEHSAVSSLAPSFTCKGMMQVRAISVDSFVSQRPGIDVGLIKTDIEGHDLNALFGMMTVVARHQPLILSECSYSPQLRELCEGWGYNIFTFARDPITVQTQFRAITASGLKGRRSKMLFLVPPHLLQRFKDFATKKAFKEVQNA